MLIRIKAVRYYVDWEGLVAELPSNLAGGLSGRRDSGPRMGGYSEYSQYSQYPDYPSLDQYLTQFIFDLTQRRATKN